MVIENNVKKNKVNFFMSLINKLLFKSKQLKIIKKKDKIKYSFFRKIRKVNKIKKLFLRKKKACILFKQFIAEYFSIKIAFTNEELISLLQERKYKKELYIACIDLLKQINEIEYNSASFSSKQWKEFQKKIKQIVKQL